MKMKLSFTSLPPPVLFAAGHARTLDKSRLDQFFERLTEERLQWQAVNSTLHCIWRALTIPSPANQEASALPLPQEA